MRRSTDAGLDPGRRPTAGPRLHAPAAVLFLSFVDVFALLPTVAPHVESLGAGPFGIGLAVAAYSAANLPANVVGGVLIDRIGRRPILVAGLVLAAVAVAAYPLAASVPWFIATRFAHGAAGGILVPAVFAVAGDRIRAGQAGRAFGRLGALIGLAAVVAPATAGIVRQAAGTGVVFLGVAGVLLIGAVIAAAFIRDDPMPSALTTSKLRPAMGPLLRSRPLRLSLAATVSLTAAVGVLAAFLPGVAQEAGAPPSAVGGLFTAYAVVAGAVMLSPLSGRVDRSAGPRFPAIGLGVLGAALLWLATASTLWSLTVGSALFGAGYGLVFPAAAAATSATADHASRGRAFGLFNATFSLGIAAGPPAVGLLVARIPGLDAFAITGTATTVVAGVLWWAGRPTGISSGSDRSTRLRFVVGTERRALPPRWRRGRP